MERFEIGSATSAIFDFRIYQFEDRYLKVFDTSGYFEFADHIDLPAGDYMFFLAANGGHRGPQSGLPPGVGGVSFDVLLTIPEPSTALLISMGLIGLGVRRRVS